MSRLRRFLHKPTRLAFLFSLLLYLVIRLVGLEDFPIYFFSDEAIQSVHAADLIRDQFYSPYGEFLPTFFMNGGQYNLSTSVYLQVLPVLLLGKEVWVTRGVAVLVSLLAALAVGLMVEKALDKRLGWLAVMVLSLMPAWFLHSRTAFETSLAVSFYAAFVCCYVLYRLRSPHYLYAAAVFAALAFYSYNPARIYVGLTLLGLFFSDMRYHWQQRRTFLKALVLGLFFLVPFIRFSLDHPGESLRHLEILGSYWVQNLPVGQKMGIFALEYLRGLNPGYWFYPHHYDLERHLMKGYGHLWIPAFPFVVIGIVWCIKHFKLSFARLVLVCFLVAPAGASVVELGITRALVMVIPVTLLTVIGMKVFWDWLYKLIERRKAGWLSSFSALGIGVFVLMSFLNGHMLVDVLKNGATWFSNYGLYGMQYGARHVFNTIEEDLAEDPHKKFYLTSTWTNGADVLARYFFDDPVPFQLGSIDGYINEYKALDPEMIFIMIPEEMKNMMESRKFTHPRTYKVLEYPNGEPGFYFVSVSYTEGVDKIFEEEQATRRALNPGQVVLQDGEEVEVVYSTLDMGEIFHIFDGDRSTLARTWEANPLRMIITFKQPRPVEKIVLRVGGEATRIEVVAQVDGEEDPLELLQELEAEADPRFTELILPEKVVVKTVEV
ncbi:MAG TPA: glycosyltransferase family 39 protein, partial [Anaerolineaceae bacterium]|nr:glycosyltransferase family 39 protein [Anaerolineaceae bacterium]